MEIVFIPHLQEKSTKFKLSFNHTPKKGINEVRGGPRTDRYKWSDM